MTEVIPILHVGDARAAVAFYGLLGFRFEWEHQFEPGFPLFVSVTDDEAHIFLSEHAGDARPGTTLYMDVDDADAVYASLRAAAVAADPPVDQPWGRREFEVVDPDGNRLRIATRAAA